MEDSGGPPPELLALPPKTTGPAPPTITVPVIRELIPAAVARWEAAGLERSTIEADLRGLRIIVADLAGSILGEASPGRLWIDTNAAGYGWFIDRTPRNDREFSEIVAPTELQAVGDSPAAAHVDLLTVVMHELGHLFGLPDAAGQASAHDVMSEVLGLSTRRLPDAADLALLSTAALQPPGNEEVGRDTALVDALFRDSLIKAISWRGASEPARVAARNTEVDFLS